MIIVITIYTHVYDCSISLHTAYHSHQTVEYVGILARYITKQIVEFRSGFPANIV